MIDRSNVEFELYRTGAALPACVANSVMYLSLILGGRCLVPYIEPQQDGRHVSTIPSTKEIFTRLLVLISSGEGCKKKRRQEVEFVKESRHPGYLFRKGACNAWIEIRGR